jgi:hypothetical protein
MIVSFPGFDCTEQMEVSGGMEMAFPMDHDI